MIKRRLHLSVECLMTWHYIEEIIFDGCLSSGHYFRKVIVYK